MTKVVYNACFGCFGLSDAAMMRYAELKGLQVWPEKGDFGSSLFWLVPPSQRTNNSPTLEERDLSRTDPLLIQVVEELGDLANGLCAKLAVAEVPAGSRYRIDEYDGNESVMTPDDYDWQIA